MSIEDYHDIPLSAEEIDSRLLGLVRGDVRQNKSEEWKAQARQNIGAGQSDTAFKISAHFDELQDLIDYYEAIGTQPEIGVMYSIGTTAPFNVYVYDGIVEDWVNYGRIDLGNSLIEDSESFDDRTYSSNKIEAELANRDDAIQFTQQKISVFTRPNLLNNWYFVGGGSNTYNSRVFPINSKGQTVYTNPSGRVINKWMAYGGTVTLTSNYMALAADSDQLSSFYYEERDGLDLDGKTVTASLLTDEGLFTIAGTFPLGTMIIGNKGYVTFGVHSGGTYPYVSLFNIHVNAGQTINVIAAKVELGDFQTLVHQKDGEWILNEVPTFEEEYAKCVNSLLPYEDMSLTADQKQKFRDNIGIVDPGWDLLWTNASPTSNFAAQTISLNLSAYDFVAIDHRNGNQDDHQIIICSKGQVARLERVAPLKKIIYVAFREATVYAGSISFSAGTVGTTSAENATDNSACIPNKIWGIRRG